MKNSLYIQENYCSRNLWEKVNLLTEEQIGNIKRGLEWTVNNFPNAVLIGGTATVHYITSARDLTPDLDFLVNDIGLVRTRLSRDSISFERLYVGGEKSLGLVVEEFNTDYLDANVGNVKLNRLILTTPNTGNIGGYQVKIINPELLAIMKFELGRDRDINDAFLLLSSGKINIDNYKKYANELKGTLQDYESIIAYKTLIP